MYRDRGPVAGPKDSGLWAYREGIWQFLKRPEPTS